MEEEEEVTINEREWTIYLFYNLIKLDPIVTHFIDSDNILYTIVFVNHPFRFKILYYIFIFTLWYYKKFHPDHDCGISCRS